MKNEEGREEVKNEEGRTKNPITITPYSPNNFILLPILLPILHIPPYNSQQQITTIKQ